jgi:hypothetical protein
LVRKGIFLRGVLHQGVDETAVDLHPVALGRLFDHAVKAEGGERA